MQELIFMLFIPMIHMGGLVLLGLCLRVDKKGGAR